MNTTAPTAIDQLYLDLFTTALEGGIGYWSEAASYHWSHSGDDLTLGTGLEDYKGFYADIESPDEDFEPVRIDRDVINKGYRLAVTPAWRKRLAWSTEPPPFVVGPETDWDYDAGDADMIVQLGLFEDVVYG